MEAYQAEGGGVAGWRRAWPAEGDGVAAGAPAARGEEASGRWDGREDGASFSQGPDTVV